MTKKLAVIPADGFFGAYAEVVSTHSTLQAAERAARPTGAMRWQVVMIQDGAKKGDKVHSQDIRRIGGGRSK
jgi:hypothetical protein